MDDSLGNGRNLSRSLPLSEDDFGESLPDAPVVVDARESEVFECAVAQKLKEARLGRLRRYRASVHCLEKGQEFRPVHRDKSLTRVDFRPSWAIKYPIVPCDEFIFL